jgi:DNA-binding HxlR family transcriptional regulator
MEDCVVIPQTEENIRALQDTIYVIGGKWKLPILFSICNGHKHFKEIQRSIPGITTRMLSRNLKELEDNKLITRKEHEDISVTIEYDFTDYSREYGILINQMIEWGKRHRKIITSK